MAPAQRATSRYPTQRLSARARPYYFYIIGVVAAIGAAALVISAEVQGKNPAALGIGDVSFTAA